ncbi:hypothetical protein Y1Q_0016078 [Alligator mississippiensis]|uniref:Uncharacterized protein n=1 Tax=Alligator mississippiensis TaxID=8496 RepID=A0A151P155_ALLMI|nr:hypothetical protein Y1Q_0016078 [Alligator mississippiensis]
MHTSVLPLQVELELLDQVLEGGSGHAEAIQPLLVVPSILDKVASVVRPDTVGLEAQEYKSGPSSGIVEPLIGFPGGSSYVMFTFTPSDVGLIFHVAKMTHAQSEILALEGDKSWVEHTEFIKEVFPNTEKRVQYRVYTELN